ncbi:MAG: hypothetical protein SNI70_06265 [Rikenellaceae bacterium]
MRRLVLILLLVLPCAVTAQESLDYDIDRVSRLSSLHKGEWVGSIAASFGNLSSDNSTLLLLLQDIDANGSISSVKPSVGYFYSDRSMAGVRFAYSDIVGEISSAILDLGSTNDLELDVPYVKFNSRTYSYGLYHRSYTKIDAKGQFELFAEIDILYGYGRYDIEQDITGSGELLHNKTSNFSIGFSPGLAVNITPNVATFVSFGLGGFSYNHIRQYDEQWEHVGDRRASQFNLSVDLLAIDFGLTFHFWDNKR